MNTLTHESATDGQIKQIARVASDAAEKAVKDYANFSKEGAQQVHASPEFAARIREAVILALTELSSTDKFKDEEVRSNYTYPPEYTGVKPIGEQVDILAKIFGLSLGYTSEWIEKVLPTLTLPEGADGWFAIPSLDAIRKRFFPEVKDDAEAYCRAVQLVHEKLGASRKFYNYREGQITKDRLRVHTRTAHALDLIAEHQKGDILIVPAQFGLRHRGRSVRRAREVFTSKEFGLGAFAVGCMALTHPERFVRWEQLHTDAPGDEFAPDAVGGFSSAPLFLWYGGKLWFAADWFGAQCALYGSVSAFLPQ